MKLMKSAFWILVGVALCLCLLFAAQATAVAYADEPIILATADDLVDFSDAVWNDTLPDNVVCELVADIDVSEREDYMAIGSNISAFSGTFHGNGHTITVDVSDYSETGVFGFISATGKVYDLTVRGAVVATEGRVGGIAGVNNGVLENCVNYATISGNNGDSYGGIAGQNGGTIKNCINYGDIEASYFVGGITGKNAGASASVTSCVNFGNITVNGGGANSIGGLVGACSAPLSDSYSQSYITLNVSSDRVGFVVGYLTAPAGRNAYAVRTDRTLSTDKVVGYMGTNDPGYRFVTKYELLAKRLVFSDETLDYLDYEEGFGYFPTPAFVTKALAEKFRLPLLTGEGTELSPYLLANEEDFDLFSVNSKIFSYAGKYLIMTATLILPAGQNVGDADTPFAGSFDGDSWEISVTIPNGGSYAGLFAKIAPSGVVKNLYANVAVSGTDWVGGIAGYSSGIVRDVTIYGTVTGDNYVGGVVGATTNSILRSYSSCTVAGVRYVGGIAGVTTGSTATDLAVSGDVAMKDGGASYAYFGGIFGTAEGTTATGLAMKGNVVAAKADFTGGLIGRATVGVAVSNAAIVGTISGKNQVGGAVGQMAVQDGLDVNDNPIYVAATGAPALFAQDLFVLGNVNGAKYVGGLTGSGVVRLERGYFSGKLGKVQNAEIDETTFRTIAPTGSTLVTFYYNSDIIYSGTDGTGKCAVALTRGDLLTGEKWTNVPFTILGGYFPFVDAANKISSDATVLSKLAYSYFYGGNGNDDRPFLIKEEIHYRNLSYLCQLDTAFLDKHYLVVDDVTFVRAFDPIAGTFGGTFNGDYYVIENLLTTEGVGAMFASIGYGATVKNLGVSSGESLVATFAAENGGTLSECVSLSTIRGSGNLGGLVGTNNGTVEKSLFGGKLYALSTASKSGGIAAVNEDVIVDCVVNGYFESYGVFGGIAGNNTTETGGNGSINRCVVTGTLHKKGASAYLGGFAGEQYGGSFNNLLFLGVVFVDGEAYVSQSNVGLVAGKYDGTHVPTVGVNVYFDSDYCVFTSQFGTINVGVTSSSHTSTYISSVVPTAFDGFAHFSYDPDLLRDDESNFSPLPEYFYETSFYFMWEEAYKASKMRVFGWDGLSFEPWGSEGNPYLVSTEAQLLFISDSVDKQYSYLDKYFLMTSDITVTSVFFPIGKFVSSSSFENRIFSGTFDGGGHVLDGFDIDETAEYAGYVALFPYTGSQSKLTGLTIGPNATLRSAGAYVGSFVGSNGGTIEHCISYATLTGTGFVGGIAAVSAAGTNIVDCVFAGTFDVPVDAPNVYGITSQSSGGTPTFTTKDSWYIFGDGSFLEVNDDSLYHHNDYGSVLYVDRGGSVTIDRTILNEGTDQEVRGIKFFLHPNDGLRGELMDVGDRSLYVNDASGYSTATDQNVQDARVATGKVVKYYVRFTAYTQTDYAGAAIGENYGAGYYYQGQVVTFRFNVSDGYYLDDHDYTAVSGTWLTPSDTVNFSFVKPAGAYNLPLEVKAFGTDVRLIRPASLEYSATAKTVSVLYVDEEKFGEEGIEYYIGNVRAPEIKNVATYTVKAKIYLANGNRFCGTIVDEFDVTKRSLAVNASDAEYWSTFACKEYDGSATAQAVVANAHLTGIAGEDGTKIVVRATITLDSATAGNRTATIGSFVLSGSASGNYELAEATLTDIACVVAKKNVTYSVPESNLTGQYTGSAPAIVGSLSAGIGAAEPIFSFAKLTEQESLDEAWAALPAGNKTWSVGKYRVTIVCSDETNYDLHFTSEYLDFVVTPYVVTSLSFSGYESLVYDGEEKDVLGYYTTVNGATERVTFAFFRENREGEYAEVPEARNAGNYRARPFITQQNYELSASIEPLLFTIAKNSAAGEIAFEFDGSTSVSIGSSIPLTVSSELYDAELIVVPYGATRGKAVVLPTGENTFDFSPTSYVTGDSFTFRLAAVGSENYTDRYSGVRSVTVIAGSLYVGLAEDSTALFFGDEPDLAAIYSYHSDLSDPVDPTTIPGFVAPTFKVDGAVLHASETPYSVSVIGGDSDGYKIVPVDSRCFVTVVKRPITVLVTGENGNGKTYGEEDGVISYTLVDGQTGDRNPEFLPNGESFALSGSLARAAGERVGRYDILIGTIASENGDYEIELNVMTQYVIEKRGIQLVVNEVRKQYGEDDPEITFSPIPATPYAKESDASTLTVVVSRASGEDVGRYAYSVDAYNGNDNYSIERIDFRTNYFIIERAIPVVHLNLIGELHYGDELRELSIVGEAFYNGERVAGTFRWVAPEMQMTAVTDHASYPLEFVPTSDNFDSVTTEPDFPVYRRVLDVNFGGDLVYAYTGKRQCNITATVINAVFDDEVPLVESVSGQAINVGEYVYSVSIGGSNSYYISRYVLPEEIARITFRILPKTLSIKVKDADVEAGGTYRPEIEYDGFVNGETASVLTKKPTVTDLPTEGGTYILTASGAEAKNYEFAYLSGVVRIGKTSATSGMASIQGDLPAETVVTSVALTGTGLSLKESELNVALKYNVFIPNFRKIADYVAVDSNVEFEGEVTYTVRIKLPNNAKIYLVKADGSIEELTDYEIVESTLKEANETDEESGDDGRTEITFDSDRILGIAVYTNKDVKEIATSLLPDIGIVLALIVVIVVIVVICSLLSQKEKRRQAYRRRIERGYDDYE